MMESAVPANLSGLAPELEAYYHNRKLLYRNIVLIMIANAGWVVCLSFIIPLIILRLNTLGTGERAIGTMQSINFWVVGFLVMYFSWKSDHCQAKIGRRLPFLFIAVPVLLASLVLFPWFAAVPVLLLLWALLMLSTDIKGSTLPLLSIDCIPKAILARVLALNAMVYGVVGFLGLRYGIKLADRAEWLPYLLAAGIICCTTLAASFIKEPPVRIPATETFKPWSALQVGWKDRRKIIMMLGVAMIHSFMIMFNTWVWLYAKNDLQINRADCGEALSWSALISVAVAFPAGWAIDKLGSNKVVIGFWILEVATFFYALTVHSIGGLIVLSVLICCMQPLYNGADVMVYKSCAPEVVGSTTASNSFLRNMYIGTLTVLSGVLIQATHSYRIAFVIGIAMSTIGLIMFGVYHRLMNRRASQPSADSTVLDSEPVETSH